MNSDLFYWVALSQIKGVGAQNAKKILSKIEFPNQLFELTSKDLKELGITQTKIVDEIINKKSFEVAEKQIRFAEKNKIDIIHFQEKKYPERLLHCIDSPIIIYKKGNLELNNPKVISVVGTRKATDYGKKWCRHIIEQLKGYNVLIVSGLAYGVDACAHQAALDFGLPTAAVLGHGLHMIYPAAHKNLARDIAKKGALITEFTTSQSVVPGNFLSRNRIVAGISDATIIVESARKGGAMQTAQMANSYSREVFAIPGALDYTQSEGPNHLIKTNQAALLTDVSDIEYLLNWQVKTKTIDAQRTLAFLEQDEQQIIDLMPVNEPVNVDILAANAKIHISKISVILLNLEFKGYIYSLPGKMYQRIN